MVILVTGSGGFIGKHLVARLRKDGHEVFTADKKNMGDILAWCSELPPTTDIVYHLAAETGLASSFGAYLVNNVVATHNMLDLLNYTNLKKFILTSTSSVYGESAVCNEHGLVEPISNYGVTKLMQEELCRMYRRVYNLPLTTMRLFSVYGPDQREDMAISKFIKAALNDKPVTVYGDGQQLRGVTYIDDVIDALVLAMNIPNSTYNVGGPEQISTNGILRAVEEVTGKTIKREHVAPREGDQVTTRADTRKLSHLGWKCKVSFIEGLRRQVEAADREYTRGN